MKCPEILYQDDAILVCVKPAGVATQTSRVSEPDLCSILKNELYKKDRTKEPYLGVVHRLDQPVSGILVFARTKAAAAELTRQLNKDSFTKEYLALTSLRPEKEEEMLVDWLLKDGRTNLSQVVMEGTPGAKRAELSYRVIEVVDKGLLRELSKICGREVRIPEQAELLEVSLKTGRHHQIRVQMANAGCPLLGDTKYNREASAKGTWQQIALCAWHLIFRHPKTGKQMEFKICPGFLR